MGMKGISPVIASVILIGISIAVGVLLSSWVTHWVSSRTQEANNACVTSTNYKIDEASFNSETNIITLVITNLGSTEIYGFSVQIMNKTDPQEYNSENSNFIISPDITQSNPLKQQRSAIITFKMEDDWNVTLVKTADIIKVLNKACPAFSAETSNIIKE
jgi:hypothetical protein